MDDLSIERTTVGVTARIKLVGKMTETARYVFDAAGVEAVEFDFEAISMINSKGLQIWKEFMKSLSPLLQISYVRCPLKVVNQLNLFPSFKGGKSVDVASFYAPYFCEPCDRSVSVLLKTSEHFAGGTIGEPPALACPDCKKPMDFDGNAQKYFLFLKRAS